MAACSCFGLLLPTLLLHELACLQTPYSGLSLLLTTLLPGKLGQLQEP